MTNQPGASAAGGALGGRVDSDPAASGPGDEPREDATEDDGVEPVELLVQLAEDGEIDPWDVDIVAVTEEFLAALDEGDLRNSGRALFYASVLLRMKSDALLEDDEEGHEDEREPWEAPAESAIDAPPTDPVAGLEAEMERRLDRKTARGSPETLDELVRELREAERESWWKESREYDTDASPSGFRRGTQTLDYHAEGGTRAIGEPTEEEITERTHGEDIETTIDDVHAALTEQYDAGRDEVLFAEIELAGGTRVQTFLATLFLANRGEIRLRQDDLFGDLWLQNPSVERGSESAIAD